MSNCFLTWSWNDDRGQRQAQQHPEQPPRPPLVHHRGHGGRGLGRVERQLRQLHSYYIHFCLFSVLSKAPCIAMAGLTLKLIITEKRKNLWSNDWTIHVFSKGNKWRKREALAESPLRNSVFRSLRALNSPAILAEIERYLVSRVCRWK